MLEKLSGVVARYKELSLLLSQPGATDDMQKWQALVKEHAALEPIFTKAEEYRQKIEELSDLEELLSSDEQKELKDIAQSEIKEIKEQLPLIEEELNFLLLPKDPRDEKNVILEVRAGTGGEEAALFGATLVRMYTRYAERHNLKVDMIDSNMTELGGVKEVVMNISGNGAYSKLKYESGVHRVQRVPSTESQGRIHTSAATVAVMPEAEEVELNIQQKDLRIDVYRSGGHGGQSVNTTDSAVRITHLPTGLVVICQDEKSQLKNKEKAMKVLVSRLLDMYESQKDDEESKLRREMVGSGDRSQRIRTYNFPQGRVTDHRINLTIYRLDDFIDGDMDEMIDALTLHERAKLLENSK